MLFREYIFSKYKISKYLFTFLPQCYIMYSNGNSMFEILPGFLTIKSKRTKGR